VKNYPGKIFRVWRHFPLSIHPGAERTHLASECAAEQGKFWEYHNKIFQSTTGDYSDEILTGYAKELDLNNSKFKSCLASEKYRDKVIQDMAKGDAIGVEGTPAVFINGRLVSGARPYAYFEQIVKSELAQAQS
jgi:protein-disulfide isomerase